jgi:hypothetical protein
MNRQVARRIGARPAALGTVFLSALAACGSGQKDQQPPADPVRKGPVEAIGPGQDRSREVPVDASPRDPAAKPGDHRAAFEVARPAFERHCFRCHRREGAASRKVKIKAIKHLDMSVYPFGGHHPDDAASVIRRALLGDEMKKTPPTMPADDIGGVTGKDLEKLLAWADAFERATADGSLNSRKRPLAPAGGHRHH